MVFDDANFHDNMAVAYESYAEVPYLLLASNISCRVFVDLWRHEMIMLHPIHSYY